MPRRARLILPNVPLHVTQRGVNRAAIFIKNGVRDTSDIRLALFRHLLGWLDDIASSVLTE